MVEGVGAESGVNAMTAAQHLTDLPLFQSRAPDITANRHRGAATSVDAHCRITAELPERRRQVLEWIRSRGVLGATVHEVAAHFGVSPNVVSGRLTELRVAGLILKNGARRGHAAVLVIA